MKKLKYMKKHETYESHIKNMKAQESHMKKTTHETYEKRKIHENTH